MQVNPIIECENLRYSYNKTEVLHGIDFTIQYGRIVGLLGKNGAGKSTTINTPDVFFCSRIPAGVRCSDTPAIQFLRPCAGISVYCMKVLCSMIL